MTVSLVRINDRMIHGSITAHWVKGVPYDGVIAANDKAHDNPILKEAYKSTAEGQGRKRLAWTMSHFKEVQDRVLALNIRYFLITKNPLGTKTILVDWGFKPSDANEVIVGPGNNRPGVIKSGDNQSLTQEERDVFEAIVDKGYRIRFALLPDK